MAEERTDYWILGIVGAVAIIAIVAMYDYTTVADAMPEQQPDYVPVVRTGGLIGDAVFSPRPADYTSEGKYDYNSDGRLTEADSELLADYLGQSFCPRNVDCDLDNNGELDSRDLGLFNVQVLAAERDARMPVDKRPSRSRTFMPGTAMSVGSTLA